MTLPRFAHFAMQIRGGAGLSTLKLHEALLREGFESKLYVGRHSIFKDKATKIPTKSKYKQNWWKLGTIPIDAAHHNIMSSGHSGLDDNFINEAVEQANIIVLRWITATISDYQISKLCKSGKPLLWVLSDMAPFTGGCHYSNDCHGYQKYCFPCPLLSEAEDRSCQLTLTRRKRFWSNINVIAPSKWISAKAKESTIFRDMPIHVIRTGVELDVYYPSDRLSLRNDLGIENHDIAILFGADSANDPRKGYNLIEPTLSILKTYLPSERKIIAIVFGSNSDRISVPGCRIISIGPIDPEAKNILRDVYSAADVTLLPYIEDNLPNIMLESIACGTPVACFDVCGMKDIVVDSINGFMAHPFDPRSLAIAIIRCLESSMTRQSVREWAESNLDIKRQAQTTANLAITALESMAHKKEGSND